MLNLLKTEELNLSCTWSLFFKNKFVYPTFKDQMTHPEKSQFSVVYVEYEKINSIPKPKW